MFQGFMHANFHIVARQSQQDDIGCSMNDHSLVIEVFRIAYVANRCNRHENINIARAIAKKLARKHLNERKINQF